MGHLAKYRHFALFLHILLAKELQCHVHFKMHYSTLLEFAYSKMQLAREKVQVGNNELSFISTYSSVMCLLAG
jgi:hypothetical protein